MTQETVDKLKNSPNFSPVLKLQVPKMSAEEDRKENVDRNMQLTVVSRRLSTSLQSELKSVLEDIRLYSYQRFAEYERYKERAYKEYNFLASIVDKVYSEQQVRQCEEDLARTRRKIERFEKFNLDVVKAEAEKEKLKIENFLKMQSKGSRASRRSTKKIRKLEELTPSEASSSASGSK